MNSYPRSGVRICHVSAVDTSMSLLTLPLMKLQQDLGHDVTAVAGTDSGTSSSGDPHIAAAGIPFHEIRVDRTLLSTRHLRSLVQYVRLFRSERFDVVHVHTPVAAFIARLAAWITRIPLVVYTAHGFYFHDHTPQPMRTLAIGAEWLAGRATDLLLSQSGEDAEVARRLRLSRGPIVEIGNGVDPGVFRPDIHTRSEVRRSLGVTDERPIILIVARLVEEKGYIELFQAFEGLEADLWIIGLAYKNSGGDDVGSRLQDEISRTDRRNRITYLGQRDGVNRFMQAADIFVLPSHREGMPRTIIEAMMTGLPVVASNIRGSREEVVDGVTGLLCDVGNAEALSDALRVLIGDVDMRSTLGLNGRCRALEHFVESESLARQINAIAESITASEIGKRRLLDS